MKRPDIVLAASDLEQNSRISALSVDMLELRVDLFKTKDIAHARAQFISRRKLGIPLILTIRNQKKEGAGREFSDSQKWALMQELMPLTDWVDIELSSPLCSKVTALARAHKKRVIISMHNFKQMPANLNAILKKALSTRADIVKIAAHANSPDDLVRMIECTHQNQKQPLVTMCVGPYGALSRLILPTVGSRWIYTFLSKPTAPGQIDIKTLQSHLKLYGLCS